MRVLRCLSHLQPHIHYDTVAIDIYGVLHNGVKTYPFSQSALASLSATVNTVLLSNSSRLGPVLAEDLCSRYAIPPTTYHTILSSGEITRMFLKECVSVVQSSSFSLPHEDTCFATARPANTAFSPTEFVQKYLTTGKFFLLGDISWHGPIYESLAPTISPTHDWEAMEFVVLGKLSPIVGQEGSFTTMEKESVQAYYQSFLETCKRRQVPIVCANPDVWAPHGEDDRGQPMLVYCPGFLAELYEAMGGQVIYFGKPHGSIYQYLLKTHRHKSDTKDMSCRVLCIGDNVATDIAGATQAGLDVVMVLGGVHANVFSIENKEEEEDSVLIERVRQLCLENGTAEPTFIMPLMKYEE
ncbi:HAD-like domain-containing protein [Spinellus fusiger]|nr:HAD-like domain-containing protein [Spinellus fusiger]